MAELKKHYAAMVQNRSTFDADATMNARYTLDAGVTAIGPSGDNLSGTSGASAAADDFELVSSFGKSLVHKISSTLSALIFPPRVPFMALDVEFTDANREATTEQLGELSKMQKQAMRRFDRMRGKSIVTEAITHAIVANAALLHWHGEDDNAPDRIRMFPFRSFALEYEDTFLRRLIVHEERYSLDTDDCSGGADGVPKEKKTAEFWTEVDFIKGTVRQEDTNGEIEEKEDKAVRWMVISNQPPYVGQHYPRAFVSHHIETLRYLNVLYTAFRDITGEMANVIRGVKPGRGLDYTDVAKWSGPTCVEMMNEDDIFLISSSVKINDASFVGQVIERLEDWLLREFLHGLLQRQGKIETATEVREIATEMSAVNDRLYTHHAQLTQMPIALALMDMEGVRLEGEAGRIEPVILTGVSAIIQQEAAEKLFEIYVAIVKVNPEFAQEFPIGKMFKRMADAHHIETGDLFPDKLQFIEMAKMLLAQVKQNPAETLPVLMQIFQSVMPEGGAQGAGAGAGDGRKIVQNATRQLLPQGVGAAEPQVT